MKTNEHCGFKLIDIDYKNEVVVLEKNDGTEKVKFSFEFIRDIADMTKKTGVA